MKNEIPDWVKKLLSEEEKFWKTEYPAYSFEDKVRHWSSSLHKQMRSQVESGLDPYIIYSPEWYSKVKGNEPRFDEIMDIVFDKYWKDDWRKDEYLKRINRK